MSSKRSAGKNKTGNKNEKSKGSNIDIQDTKDEQEPIAFSFKYLTMDNTIELLLITDYNILERKVFDVLSMIGVLEEQSDYSIDIKVASVLDFYVAAIWWAIEHKFTSDQLSTFFTIIHVLIHNIREKNYTLVENVTDYKAMLLGVMASMSEEDISLVDSMENNSIQNANVINDSNIIITKATPQIECMNVEQISDITKYIENSIFRHYKLYEYIFGCSQAEEIIGTNIALDTPLSAKMFWPPPLAEGILEPIHTRVEYLTDNLTCESPKDPVDDINVNMTQDKVDIQHPLEDILTKISPEKVRSIMKSVFNELLNDVKDDLANKIRQRENSFISRINKIHKVAPE